LNATKRAPKEQRRSHEGFPDCRLRIALAYFLPSSSSARGPAP
jgi:hypothetical protein